MPLAVPPSLPQHRVRSTKAYYFSFVHAKYISTYTFSDRSELFLRETRSIYMWVTGTVADLVTQIRSTIASLPPPPSLMHLYVCTIYGVLARGFKNASRSNLYDSKTHGYYILEYL